uniref:Uncharacterized protein n=1 Tax=Anguilla anguilla TaxID=7936 RepID=A0A0E9QAX1_ANGAN
MHSMAQKRNITPAFRFQEFAWMFQE